MPEKAISILEAIDFSVEDNLLDPNRPTVKLTFHHHREKPRVEELDFDMARLMAANLNGLLAQIQRANLMRRKFR
jgi:hypothetical protein